MIDLQVCTNSILSVNTVQHRADHTTMGGRAGGESADDHGVKDTVANHVMELPIQARSSEQSHSSGY